LTVAALAGFVSEIAGGMGQHADAITLMSGTQLEMVKLIAENREAFAVATTANRSALSEMHKAVQRIGEAADGK